MHNYIRNCTSTSYLLLIKSWLILDFTRFFTTDLEVDLSIPQTDRFGTKATTHAAAH